MNILYSFLVSTFAKIVPFAIIGLGILIIIGGITAISIKRNLKKKNKCNCQYNTLPISKSTGDGVNTLSSADNKKESAPLQANVPQGVYRKRVYNLEVQHQQDKKFCQRLSSKNEVYQHYDAQNKKLALIESNVNRNSSCIPCENCHPILKANPLEPVVPKENKIDLMDPIVLPLMNGLINLVPQIVNGLALYAMRREECQASEGESFSTSSDIMSSIYDGTELSLQNKVDEDICEPVVVPYWEHTYVYSVDDLQAANRLQRNFYRFFKEQFLKENYLDIDDNSNYAFVLMFDLAEDYKKHKNYALVKQQLDTLAVKYPVVIPYINRTLLNVVSFVNQENAENTLKSVDKSRGQLCKWIKSNEIVEVQGIKLTRGNFYVGECFRLPDNVIRDNRYFGYKGTYIFGPVINPELPVSDSNIKNFFCSYNDMSPAWRYEYLMWLSGKIQTSDVPVEIILFYLYGCEIRMFIDPQTKNTERKSILLDIINLYKSQNIACIQNDSRVRQKLSVFIGNAIVKYFRDTHEEFDLKGIFGDYSTYTNYYIAQKIASKKDLSPEEAFGIAKEIYDIEQFVPSIYVGVAQKYFMDDFMKVYKNLDINLEIITKNFSICYYYNNGVFFNSERVNLNYEIEDLPSDMWNVQNAIRTSYWNVESKFRRYNQIKERYNSNEPIAAIMVLPCDIDIREHPKIQKLIASIENKLQSENFLVIPIDWLLKLWEYEYKDDKSIHKIYADSIIGGLYRLGFGIAPNYEIDSKRFNFGDICVIYRNKEHHPVKSTTKYDRSELFIKLASYIVHADKPTGNDIVFVEQQLKSYENIPGNHLHLMAVIRWRFLSKKQPIDKRTQSVIALLTSEQRTTIGNALIRLACINGDIHPKRTDSLKKVLPLLGIESENIHSQIHRLLTDSDGFAVVEKKSDAVEFTINGQPAYPQQPATPSVIINPKKLRIFEQQTKAAQELLSDIFVEEESVTHQNTETDNATSMWMEVLKSLLTKEVWERAEVETMCKERGLMLGAVLEQINDFAYEKVYDAVIEDDGENIYVTMDYKEQLI